MGKQPASPENGVLQLKKPVAEPLMHTLRQTRIGSYPGEVGQKSGKELGG